MVSLGELPLIKASVVVLHNHAIDKNCFWRNLFQLFGGFCGIALLGSWCFKAPFSIHT